MATMYVETYVIDFLQLRIPWVLLISPSLAEETFGSISHPYDH